MAGAVSIPGATVALSTASVYPDTCAAAFATAARLGYDALEVMVWTDPVSQEAGCPRGTVRAARHTRGVGARAHAPADPADLGTRPVDQGRQLDRAGPGGRGVHGGPAPAVPLAEGVRAASSSRGWRCGSTRPGSPWPSRTCSRGGPASGSSRPTCRTGTRCRRPTTTSPSTCRTPPRRVRTPWRWPPHSGPRLRHVHLADGLGSLKDEHLVPGRGSQPCAEFLEMLALKQFAGSVVVEVSTRKVTPEQREVDLAEALAFARLHLATASTADAVMSPRGRRPGGVDTRAGDPRGGPRRLRRAGL